MVSWDCNGDVLDECDYSEIIVVVIRTTTSILIVATVGSLKHSDKNGVGGRLAAVGML